MVCPKCGGNLRDSAKFCSWCGEKIPEHISMEVPDTKEPEITVESILEETLAQAPVPQPPAPKKSIPKPEHMADKPEPDEPPPELAVEFSETEDLFVVSEQPAPAVSKNSGNENIPLSGGPYKSIRFPIRSGFAVLAATILAMLCLSSIYVVPNHILPLMKYKSAEKLFLSGDYETARYEFADLGDYSDSRDYVLKCRYESTVLLMESGSFAEAAKEFSALDGYADSDDLAAECLIRSAEIYMESGNFNAAVSAYYAAGRPELAENISKERAEALAGSGDYFAAAEIAEKYSRDDAMEYIYLGSEKAMNDGDFQTAAKGFEALGEYKDSAELSQECTYSFYRSEYNTNGVSGDIVRGFRSLGNYKDCETLYIQTAYEYGTEMFESGNYYEASSMFRNTGSYKDSPSMLHLSRYELGKSLEQTDPVSAHSIFAMLGNYSDSAARKKSTASNLGGSISGWYADGFTSADDLCTSEFKKSDTLTVSCTAGTDSPSAPVTLVITFMDNENFIISADCEDIRNSGSFSANIPLSSAAVGNAEITVSLKDNGKILRRFTITIGE